MKTSPKTRRARSINVQAQESARAPGLRDWKRRVADVQREVSSLYHSPLPSKLEGTATIRMSLRIVNMVLNGLSVPERHDGELVQKLHNVARGGNLYSAGSADLFDAVLHVRHIKLIWPDQLADGIRERLTEYGQAFATETTRRIEELLRDTDPQQLRTFAAPTADLVMGAWVRAGRPQREQSSPLFQFPIEPKATDVRTRRALLTRILNAITIHDQA
jgi:hypothetical protein